MTRHQKIEAAQTFAEKLRADIAARNAEMLGPKLADALAAIDKAFPKPIGPAEIFARLIAAGQPVKIMTERGTVSFNGALERGGLA